MLHIYSNGRPISFTRPRMAVSLDSQMIVMAVFRYRSSTDGGSKGSTVREKILSRQIGREPTQALWKQTESLELFSIIHVDIQHAGKQACKEQVECQGQSADLSPMSLWWFSGDWAIASSYEIDAFHFGVFNLAVVAFLITRYFVVCAHCTYILWSAFTPCLSISAWLSCFEDISYNNTC